MPVPGEYEGIGQAGLARYRPADGLWSGRTDSGGPTTQTVDAERRL